MSTETPTEEVVTTTEETTTKENTTPKPEVKEPKLEVTEETPAEESTPTPTEPVVEESKDGATSTAKETSPGHNHLIMSKSQSDAPSDAPTEENAIVEGETKTDTSTNQDEGENVQPKKVNTVIHLHYCSKTDGITIKLSGNKDTKDNSTVAVGENFELERTSKFTNELFDTMIIKTLANSSKNSLVVDSFADAPTSKEEMGAKGRIKRDVQWLRRGLQSLVDEKIHGEESDDGEDEDKKTPNTFSKVQSISLDIEHYDLDVDLDLTTKLCSNIFHDSFKDKIWKPIREMMLEAGAGSFDVVLLTGLKLPGQLEFLAEQIHLMASHKAFRDTWSSLPDVLVHTVMSFVEDIFSFEDITSIDDDFMAQTSGRGFKIDFTNHSVYILDKSETWNQHKMGSDWAQQTQKATAEMNKEKTDENFSPMAAMQFFEACSSFDSQEEDDYNSGDSQYYESEDSADDY